MVLCARIILCGGRPHPICHPRHQKRSRCTSTGDYPSVRTRKHVV